MGMKVKNDPNIVSTGDITIPIMPDEIELHPDGVNNLIEAIMYRGREDYIHLRSHGIREETHVKEYGSIRALKKFLRSEYGRLYLGDVDPEGVIKNWDEQGDYEKWRLEHQCKGCKKKPNQCIHKTPGHYTAERKCLKEPMSLSEKRKNTKKEVKK